MDWRVKGGDEEEEEEEDIRLEQGGALCSYGILPAP